LNLGVFVDAFSGVGRVVDGGKRGVFVELRQVLFLSFAENPEIFRFQVQAFGDAPEL
jgi:hypothetical protein